MLDKSKINKICLTWWLINSPQYRSLHDHLSRPKYRTRRHVKTQCRWLLYILVEREASHCENLIICRGRRRNAILTAWCTALQQGSFFNRDKYSSWFFLHPPPPTYNHLYPLNNITNFYNHCSCLMSHPTFRLNVFQVVNEHYRRSAARLISRRLGKVTITPPQGSVRRVLLTWAAQISTLRRWKNTRSRNW